MEILGKILGSPARVKVMRLFILNPKANFTRKDIINKSRISPSTASKEIKLLSGVGFLKKRHDNLWLLDPTFGYIKDFERLLISSDTFDKKVISDNFRKAGKVKLLAVAGIFIKNKDSRADILIVGDKIKKGKVEDEIKKLEAEIGTELKYVVFDTKEFLYRLSMYDKLVRDILDFPHEIVLQAKELSTQTLKKA